MAEWRARFGGRHKADTCRHKAGTWRTQGKVWRRGTSGLKGQKGGTWLTKGEQGLEARPKWTIAASGHKADAQRTHAGQSAETRPKRNRGGHRADKVCRRSQPQSRRIQGGHKADARRTHRGHKADTWGQSVETRPHGGRKMDTKWVHSGHKRTQGGHTSRTQGGQSVETRLKRTQGGQNIADNVWRRGQSGLKVNTKRTHSGHKADKWRVWRRGQSGLKADKLRDAARAYRRGQPFFPKREPHSKLFGEARAYRGQPFFPKREPHSKLFGEKQRKILAFLGVQKYGCCYIV